MDDRDKYIDIFFRNGLKEYEVMPPAEVWENIVPSLKKRRKSVVFLRVAAIVAILVSLSAFSAWLTRSFSDSFDDFNLSMNQETKPSGSLVAVNQKSDIPVKHVQEKIPGKPVPTAIEILRSPQEEYIKMSDEGHFTVSLDESKLYKSEQPDKQTYNKIERYIVGGNGSVNLNASLAITENPRVPVNRWSISAGASPNYYSHMNIGTAALAASLAKNEKPEASYSGGMGFGYKVNSRISIQSGIYYSSIGQKISGINAYSGFGKYNETKGGSQFSVQTTSGTIVATNNNIYLSDNLSTRIIAGYVAKSIDPVKANLNHLDNSISQNFRYIEIPVFFRYKAIDRKIDVNFVGGLSYNMLVGNSASAIVGGTKYTIGKTEGLSPVNFSSSLGLGFEYNLSKKISLDLQPTFRYYLTPFGSDPGTSIHPYSFGVFSGIMYKF
jgi:hypothetical protein